MRTSLSLSLVSLLGLSLPAACTAQDADTSPATAQRKALQEAGIQLPLTLYPVRVLGRPSTEVADALGLVLERYGMPNLEVAEQPFDAADAAWADVPARFGAHVRQARAADAPARFRLYAEYLGRPSTGPTEVRFVLLDAAGEVVLVDQQTPADAAFQRTAGRDPDPLGCSALVGERLFALAGWKKAPGSVRDGKFSEHWRRKSGTPDKSELAAMEKRRAALRANLAQARVAVLPTLTPAGPDAASAQRLAGLVGTELGCTSSADPAGATLTVAPSSNQQKRLWDLVAAVRAAMSKQAVDADYALVADVAVSADGTRGYVNVVLCTKAGEAVVADFQNDQHPMFKKAAPKSVADAEQLAAARLARALR